MNVERRTELYLLKPHRAGIGDPEIARVYQVEIAPSNDKQKNKEPQAAREIIARDAIYNTNFYADRSAVLPMTLISSKRLFLPPIVLAGARTFGNFNIVEGPLRSRSRASLPLSRSLSLSRTFIIDVRFPECKIAWKFVLKRPVSNIRAQEGRSR